MDIEFEGQYNQEEYTRAVRMVITPSKRSTIVRIAIFAVALVIVAVIIISAAQDGTFNSVENNRTRLSLFALAAMAVYLGTPYLGINSTANRLWNKPSVQQMRSGRVSPEGITYGDKLKTWDSFIRKYVVKDMVLLITADEGMSLLPRHFFRDEMDWKRFLQMIEQYALYAKDYSK